MKRILLMTGLMFAMVNIAHARIFSSPKKPIALKKGETEFTVELTANPSTGYGWYLAPPPKDGYIHLQSHQFRREKNALPGSAGIESWTFSVDSEVYKAPMIMHFQFVIMRSWQPDQMSTFPVTVLTH